MKTNLTENELQSRFLPVIQRAETEIKKLILTYALANMLKSALRLHIKAIILEVDNKLPKELIDRQSYLDGLYETSENLIKSIYDKILNLYLIALKRLTIKKIITTKKPNTPMKLLGYINSVKTDGLRMWEQAKGSPQVANYGKELKAKINELVETPTISSSEGKKKISVWQKAEIDLRQEHQKKMVEELKDNNVKYAWTSTHPNCSKRCEKMQGKLFDLTSERSELTNHRMKHKIDGNTVYCYKEVVNKVDKYGYKNNIIVGFNCRHKLIPYTPNSKPPKDYDKEDVAKEREINAKLRAYERRIRYCKQQAMASQTAYQIAEDKKEKAKFLQEVKKWRAKAKQLTEEYKRFAEENGYAWYQYRITI